MSFEVVLAHFWYSPDRNLLILKPFTYVGGWPVMTFMLMAFILSGKSIIEKNSPKIHTRLYRLIMMQLLWTAIYFVYLMLMAIFMERGSFAGKNSQQIALSLVAQLFLGSTFNATMWFQVDLIAITFVMAFIYAKLSERVALIITAMIIPVSLAVQYSGLNIFLFDKVPFAFNKYTFGRIAEMLPIVCIGLLFAKFRLMDKLSKHKTTSILAGIFCLVILHVLKKAGLLQPPKGFMYQGIYLLCASTSLTIVFGLLPLEKLPPTTKNIISLLAGITPGIYCIHRLISDFMTFLMGQHSSFVWCMGIYVACIGVSLVLAEIAGKYNKYLVK